jgi:hypothetical protein
MITNEQLEVDVWNFVWGQIINTDSLQIQCVNYFVVNYKPDDGEELWGYIEKTFTFLESVLGLVEIMLIHLQLNHTIIKL